LGELRDVQALPAWLITVARRRACSVLQAKIPVVKESEPGYNADIVNAIEHEQAIERALEQVPPRCRELINLLYFRTNQPSYAEIANNWEYPLRA
jgi:DNA-directed RNA polymerase specialized sigma24 family protein